MSPPRGARRIRAAFEARVERRPLLGIYLMAGYPSEDVALAAIEAALEAGAGMLEIGIPFSDPVADGPVIAAAGHAAVAAGAGFETALRTARAIRDRGHEQPILAMGYVNSIVVRGAAVAARELAAAGVDGLIVPDLPAGEDPQLERLVADAGLGMAFLVAPNASPERLELAAASSTAFLYVVPVFGVTGARERVADTAAPLIARVRAAIRGSLPIGVGFGVSRPEHVRELAGATDAILVGSAVVAELERAGPDGVGRLVTSLASA